MLTLKCGSNHDFWGIELKSVWIVEEVAESMRLQEDKRLLETYDLLRKIQKGFRLVEWVFKANVPAAL